MTQELRIEPVADDIGARIAIAIAMLIGSAFAVPPAAAQGKAQLYQQAGLAQARSTLPEIAETIEARRRGLITDAEWHNVLARKGFSERAITLLDTLKESLLSPGEWLEILRRELTPIGEVRDGLEKLGFSERSIELLEELAFDVPSGQDVIRFTVREVFNPELRAALGLDTDFPAGALPSFRAAGLDEERARNEWASHWQLPSTQLAFEMLHRDEIDESDIDLILRAQDVLPRFREPIKNVAFRPLTRVDLRRMHALGVLTTEELKRGYMDIGFSSEKADLMTEFTVQFNEARDKRDTDETRALTRSQITRFYKGGLYNEDETVLALESLDYSPDDARTIALSTRLEILQDERDRQVKVIRNLFQDGAIDFNDAITRLDGLDLAANERDVLVADFEAERDSRVRMPTRSELERMLDAGLIDRGIYVSQMRLLGYPEVWANRFAELATQDIVKEAAEPRRFSRSEVVRFLRAGVFTPDEAVHRLTLTGFVEEDAQLIVELETIERPEEQRDLSRSLITRLLKAAIFTTDEARARLLGIGFSAEDTEDIITLALQPKDADANE